MTKTNQPNQPNQFTCPYCKGQKILLYTGKRCHNCSGFGLVDEMGRRRGEYQLRRTKKLFNEQNPIIIKDDWIEKHGFECPF